MCPVGGQKTAAEECLSMSIGNERVLGVGAVVLGCCCKTLAHRIVAQGAEISNVAYNSKHSHSARDGGTCTHQSHTVGHRSGWAPVSAWTVRLCGRLQDCTLPAQYDMACVRMTLFHATPYSQKLKQGVRLSWVTILYMYFA